MLPGVMGAEIFAQVATVLCPGHVVTGLRDLEFLQPVKFHRLRPLTLHLVAVGRPGAGDGLLVDVQLSSRLQPKPGLPAQERLHFRGCVLVERAALPPRAVAFQPPPALTVGREAVYRVYFHGPAYQVLEGVRVEAGGAVGVLRAGLGPNLAAPDALERTFPRLLELCFQTAGIHDLVRRGAFGLPAAVGSLRLHAPPGGISGPCFAEVRPLPGEGFDADVVDAEGHVFLELSGYRTVEVPAPASAEELRRAATAGADA
ncbi:MAG: polyketide synthase dehydratase domain-containing protein [Anaeromyxobacter sp.]